MNQCREHNLTTWVRWRVTKEYTKGSSTNDVTELVLWGTESAKMIEFKLVFCSLYEPRRLSKGSFTLTVYTCVFHTVLHFQSYYSDFWNVMWKTHAQLERGNSALALS